jgi:hypothetical protein
VQNLINLTKGSTKKITSVPGNGYDRCVRGEERLVK